MKKNILAGIFVVLVFGSALSAVNTRDIDVIREKGVLDSSDFAVIDSFIAESINELLAAVDFSTLSNVRNFIVSRTEAKSGDQYKNSFSDSLNKYIPDAFEKAKSLKPEKNSVAMTSNLLMLVEALQDMKLTDYAMQYLKSENEVIRYWAVKCVTNQFMVDNFNSSSEPIFAAKATKLLKDLIVKGDGDSLAAIVGFSSRIKSTAGNEMLLAIAERRIGEYAEWKVDNEIIDADLLNSLFDVYSRDTTKKIYVQKYAQLFAYIMQRYIKGQAILTDKQKSDLASVMIEIEQSSMVKVLGISQSIIKTAIENGNLDALGKEYARLFDVDGQKGELATKMQFDYSPGGAKPLELKAK
ncbi:MAG TPA: hypothetical protein PLP05_03310 [Sedimentisphaerales bacterium]|nr:hypothetical protein [Sedimentisphaerales bacterium]